MAEKDSSNGWVMQQDIIVTGLVRWIRSSYDVYKTSWHRHEKLDVLKFGSFATGSLLVCTPSTQCKLIFVVKICSCQCGTNKYIKLVSLWKIVEFFSDANLGEFNNFLDQFIALRDRRRERSGNGEEKDRVSSNSSTRTCNSLSATRESPSTERLFNYSCSETIQRDKYFFPTRLRFSLCHQLTIPQSLDESEVKRLGSMGYMMKLNETSVESFKECIAQLLRQQGNDIACIIYDELMYFCEAAAKEFKLPSVIFSTCSATNQVCCCVLSKLNAEKFSIDMKDPEMQDKVVEDLHPLRYKDLPTWGFGPLEPLLEVCKKVFNKRTASAVIINTVSCLESSSLSWLQQELGIPVFPLGPLHITASAPYSLLEEDKSCTEWLNKQKPMSVIYISLGSKAEMDTKEMLEMAWGLSNSNQPFLWVIRPGSESFPEEIINIVSERGYIVNWAPQIEVLAHPAVGGFWSHCGWNSVLESIVEGVPMICRPFQGEQKLNAMHIESVWRIGIQLEGEAERGVVERAVKRLIVDEEGAEMRDRAVVLKEMLMASVRNGGSSYNALDELVKCLRGPLQA